MDTKIIEQLKEAFAEELSLSHRDFGAVEQFIMEKLRLLGQGLLQRVVDSQPNGYKGRLILCKCGGYMKFVQHRERNIHTIFGWITVKRAYYYCPDCGASIVPYDQESGLGDEQVSPALAKVCCLLVTDDSFQQVSRKVEQLFGQSISDDTVQSLVHVVGKRALQQHKRQLESIKADKQRPQENAFPERLYVVADGTTVWSRRPRRTAGTRRRWVVWSPRPLGR